MDPGAELRTRAAERATARPEYLGWVLARYMESEALAWPAVAQVLGTSEPFDRLALCLRPRTESFAQDVSAIAKRFRLDAAALGRIVRLVDALHAMTRTAAASSAAGALLAARRKREGEQER